MGWPPRWLTPVPALDRANGDGGLFSDFAEAACYVDKDSVASKAGELLILRDWQRELYSHLLARRPDGRYRHRTALIGMARKGGKSALASSLGLSGLVLGPRGGEVYSCAGDKDQARIVFNTARRMVKMNPELDYEQGGILKVYRDVIEFVKVGSIYKVLSAEAYSKEGLNPHLVLFDEVHVQPNRELWSVMSLAMGARRDPLMVGITTAGVMTDQTGQDSLCYSMYQQGIRIARGEVVDPTFFMAWWEPANPLSDPADRTAWAEANPGLGDIVDPEDMQAMLPPKTPEAEYRTKRLNQWVASAQAWFPHGLWDSLADNRTVPDGADVVLSFDGSFSGDCTGLTVQSTGDLHIDVVDVWERDPQNPDWQVNTEEVENVLRRSFERWNVQCCVYDPRIWQQLFQRMAAEGYPVQSMPQGAAMIDASQRFYEDAANRRFSHSGDPRLARHVRNATVKSTPQGWRVQKETPTSPRKVDLAICAIQGHAFAAEIKKEPAAWAFYD